MFQEGNICFPGNFVTFTTTCLGAPKTFKDDRQVMKTVNKDTYYKSCQISEYPTTKTADYHPSIKKQLNLLYLMFVVFIV